MGFFDKLFGGGSEAGKAVDDLFSSLVNGAKQQNKPQNSQQPQSAPAPAAPSYEKAESGYSWGDVMPDEPNQYNFGGTFTDYFETIFREDFPGTVYSKQFTGYNNKRIVYTFTAGGTKKLVVELMNQFSRAQGVRNECAREGVPYLRFYYDHHGWWNTRAYVKDRVGRYL